ncbi:MAG TPA: hypothetical protein VGC42_03295, partial [Kofleriaceae bacterium]
MSLPKLTAALAFAVLAPACAMDADPSTRSTDDELEVALQQPDFTAARFLDHLQVCDRAAGAEVNCHAHVLVGRAGLFATVAPSGYGPSDLRSAYSITGNGSASTTIAIVDAYGYPNAEADLGVYRAQYGLSACTTANGCFKKVNQNGQSSPLPAVDPGWATEISLDLDAVSAACP